MQGTTGVPSRRRNLAREVRPRLPLTGILVVLLLLVWGGRALACVFPLATEGDRGMRVVVERIASHPTHERAWQWAQALAVGRGAHATRTNLLVVLVALAGLYLGSALLLLWRRPLGRGLALLAFGLGLGCEAFAVVHDVIYGDAADALRHLAQALLVACAIHAASDPRLAA